MRFKVLLIAISVSAGAWAAERPDDFEVCRRTSSEVSCVSFAKGCGQGLRWYSSRFEALRCRYELGPPDGERCEALEKMFRLRAARARSSRSDCNGYSLRIPGQAVGSCDSDGTEAGIELLRLMNFTQAVCNPA